MHTSSYIVHILTLFLPASPVAFANKSNKSTTFQPSTKRCNNKRDDKNLQPLKSFLYSPPPHRTFYGSSLTRVAPPTRQPRPGRHVGFKVSGLDGGEISTNIGERQDGTSFFLILPSPKLTASPTRKERILL